MWRGGVQRFAIYTQPRTISPSIGPVLTWTRRVLLVSLGLFPASCTSTPSFITDFHLSRLRVFGPLLASVDLIAFETIPLAVEITAIRQAVTLLEGKAKETPFWIGVAAPSGNWGDKGEGGLGGVGRSAFWEDGEVEGGDKLKRPFG